MSAIKEICYLHIGTAKTGTTSIQHFMSANRAGLLEQGIIYPQTRSRNNHAAFAAYAVGDDGRNNLGIRGFLDVPQFGEQLCQELDHELQASTASTILFSTERFSSAQVTESAIERMAALCTRYAARTKIIVYLRDQIDYLVSWYGQNIKGGAAKPSPFKIGANTDRIDYAALLEPWRKTFGRENMIVRRFERSDFVDGDLLSDFAALISCDISAFARAEPLNEALGARELAFLRAFNARIPRRVEGKKNPAGRSLVQALVRLSEPGRRLTVSPDVAEEIAKEFEESNRRVSEEYFGGKWQPLFPAPKLVSDTNVDVLMDLSVDDAMDVATRLWIDLDRRLQELDTPRNRRAAQDAEDDASDAARRERRRKRRREDAEANSIEASAED